MQLGCGQSVRPSCCGRPCPLSASPWCGWLVTRCAHAHLLNQKPIVLWPPRPRRVPGLRGFSSSSRAGWACWEGRRRGGAGMQWNLGCGWGWGWGVTGAAGRAALLALERGPCWRREGGARWGRATGLLFPNRVLGIGKAAPHPAHRSCLGGHAPACCVPGPPLAELSRNPPRPVYVGSKATSP